MSEPSLWQRAETVRAMAEGRALADGDPACLLIRELAGIVKELAERVGLGEERATEQMKVGEEYEVLIRVRATCTDTDDDGSVELTLEPRNHQAGRVVQLDHDEIVDHGRRT